MRIDSKKKLTVKYLDRTVGYLNYINDINKVSFTYDRDWLNNGFSISPFSLPLKDQIFIPNNNNFDGLFGVFADSFPDSWGMLLLDRKLKQLGLNLNDLNCLDKLALIGNCSDKALKYVPQYDLTIKGYKNIDLDYIAKKCLEIIDNKSIKNIDELLYLNGSSGGARPKANVMIDNEMWLVKFPSSVDNKNIGKMEYDYFACAEKCNIKVAEYRLLQSEVCDGYFASKRFDKNKLVLTASAILESDYRIPSLDYNSLIKLTKILTNNNDKEILNMFRLMCFNVFSHNRDDHGKNFSFIYDERKDIWAAAPAYDLTYSNTYYGQHTSSVDGNGINPGKDDLLRVAKKNHLGNVESIIDDIKVLVDIYLKDYLKI